MPIASYSDAEDKKSYFEGGDKPSSGNLPLGKTLAKVYGYMGIALLITAVVAFFTAWLFSAQINSYEVLSSNNPWIVGYKAMLIISGIGILILSFALPISMAKGKRRIWPFYILYAVLMGFLMTAFLLAGVDWYIIGEAFGITAVTFAVMFLVGWFSKADLNFIGFILISILSVALLISLVFFLIYAFRGFTWDQAFGFDLLISGIIALISIIVIAIDSYNIKRMLEKGEQSTNVHLYCAYCMYTDFIVLFIRILYILMILKDK